MAQPFTSKDDEITQIRERLAALEDNKARLQARLHELCAADLRNGVAPDPVAEAQEIVTQDSAAGEKVALFRSQLGFSLDFADARRITSNLIT